jgi:hypothetical protein
VVDDHAALARQLPWAPAILAELAASADGGGGAAGRLMSADGGGAAGVHLVVSTSYPVELPDVLRRRAGIRLALRAPSGEAAAHFVGSREPGAIPVPQRGRGYLRVGDAAPVAVQCPWPGAPSDDDVDGGPVRVTPFVLESAGCTVGEGTTRSQLDVVLDACAAAPSTSPAWSPDH